MKYFLVLISACILSASCTKSTTAKSSNADPNYVKGYVIVGIDSTISLEQLFNYVNPLNLSIDEISGYVYTTTIPQDSIGYIKSVLNSKSYINTRDFSANVYTHYLTNIVYNATILWNMAPQNQTDYIQTKNAFRMTFVTNANMDMVIKVPDGQEKYWVYKFKTFNWVSWAELNYKNQVILF